MRGADRVQFWIVRPGNSDPTAAFRHLDAGNDFDEGRLAGAVFADKAVYLADLQRQIDIAKRMHAAEALRNAGHLQESRQGFVLRVRPSSNRLAPRRIPDWKKIRNAILRRRLGLVCCYSPAEISPSMVSLLIRMILSTL